MPCDSVTTQSVNLANAMPDLLIQALESDGWTIDLQTETTIQAYNPREYRQMTWTKGKGLSVKGTQYTAQTVMEQATQAYARQAVAWTAQRAGWTVQQLEPNRLQIQRR